MGKTSKKQKLKGNKSTVKQKPKVFEQHKGSGDGEPKKAPKFTVDQLLDKVDELLDSFEFDLAGKFCQRALDLDPNNLRALETAATLLIECGDLEKAKNCLNQAIELSPDEGHSKYMYLGQLLTGIDAIRCFHKGIELMEKQLQQHTSQVLGASSTSDPDVTPSDVSTAYCSIAEIYLTDECFGNDAEGQCKACLDKAVATDASNAEAYQLLSSYWMSKDNKEEAKATIEKSVSLWLPQLREAAKDEAAVEDPVESCPVSYPARMSAAKILIEVENYDCASEILELLLDEEDEVVEVWYLLGWLNYLQGGVYKSNAREYLEKAQEVSKKTKFDDEEMNRHIQELLTELGPGGEGEENGDEEVEEGEEEEDEEEEEEANDMEIEQATTQEGHTDRTDQMEH